MMKRVDLFQFLGAAEAIEGDPSLRVCQLFARYAPILPPESDEILWTMTNGKPALIIDEEFPIELAIGEKPEGDEDGLKQFGADKIANGVWALTPSLNMPGTLHAFVVLFGVPDPPPWQRLIMVPA